MTALTTQFTPAPWCSDRFVVYVDDQAPGTSIIPPSSGWIDPSFTKCIPTQYTTPYPTFSPGVCPAHMEVVKYTLGPGTVRLSGRRQCCQSGFSPISTAADYLCTSAITTPMSFLIDPDVSTADIYTTLPPNQQLYVEHDQVTVQWEASDLALFPEHVASAYAVMMGVTPAPPRLTGPASIIDTAAEAAAAGETTTPSSSSSSAEDTSSSTKTSVFWPTGTQTMSSQTDLQPTITTTAEHRPEPSESDTPMPTSGAGRGLGGAVSVLLALLGVFMVLMT